MNYVKNQPYTIRAFIRLGCFLSAFTKSDRLRCAELAGSQAYRQLEQRVDLAVYGNEWFTKEGIYQSLEAIATHFLSEEKLKSWLLEYPNVCSQPLEWVGVVAAGNIPLVCFHDMLCVLISGKGLVVKPSSKDRELVQAVVDLLCYFEPMLNAKIQMVDSIDPKSVSRLIATGSDNTARYIEYKYGDIPHIIRKNRTSVAVLSGEETKQELAALCSDIFTYFGMGCRNVSKVYVPENYDFTQLVRASLPYKEGLLKHNSYRQCYLYEKANASLSNEKVLDGSFFILRNSKGLGSPLAVLSYENYTSLDELVNQLVLLNDQLQCIVSKRISNSINFGQTQQPTLSDYADGVDIMSWLTEI